MFAEQADKGAVMMPGASGAVAGLACRAVGLGDAAEPHHPGPVVRLHRGARWRMVWRLGHEARPRRYHVVALRPTTLLCLPLPLFATLRETSLAFNQFLVLHLNMRLGQAMTIEAGRTQSTEHRVAQRGPPVLAQHAAAQPHTGGGWASWWACRGRP